MTNRTDFIQARSRYRGEVKPENLVFNANLQEFSQRVRFISSLETNGKMTPEEAFHQIRSLWKQLKRSRKELGIEPHPFFPEE
ncbi:DUF7219 family protein [Leptolyngbya ohadii]|uniref:DUF7219 family protein n=1 Tax=Leptolyngbya ohadii TaxID=1962290 RepID=UPI000B59E21C|nr:hypothetical protein [Leptolyngbya ohadii]